MAIVHYIVILFMSFQSASGAMSSDFGTFANQAGLDYAMSCEDFASSPSKDRVIQKLYNTPANLQVEVYCLSPEEYSSWLSSVRNFSPKKINSKPIIDSGNMLPPGFDEHSASRTVEFTGKLITKEDGYGIAFYLEINKTMQLPVFPSEKVKYETLMQYRNRRVNVKLQYILQLAPTDTDLEANPPVSRRFYKVIELLPVLQ